VPGVAGEGAAAGARIQAQALKDAGTGFNFLRPDFAPFCKDHGGEIATEIELIRSTEEERGSRSSM
jgi:hypothetical protein